MIIIIFLTMRNLVWNLKSLRILHGLEVVVLEISTFIFYVHEIIILSLRTLFGEPRNEKAGVFGIFLILFDVTPSFEADRINHRNAWDSKQEDHGEEWGCQWAIELPICEVCADYDDANTPPHENLTEIVGMSWVLPDSCGDKLALVDSSCLEHKFLVVCGALNNETNNPQDTKDRKSNNVFNPVFRDRILPYVHKDNRCLN